MALAVLEFLVGNAVPLVGKRTQALREDREFAHLHGRLPLAGREGCSLDAHPVAAVEELPCREVLLGNLLLVQVNLDAPVGVAKRGENGFAHVADREEAAGQTHRALVLEGGPQSARLGVGLETGPEGVDAHLPELGQLLAADRDQVGFAGSGNGVGLVWLVGVGHGTGRNVWGRSRMNRRKMCHVFTF